MKTLHYWLLGACAALGACTMQTNTIQTTENGTQWEWKQGTIEVKCPERPAGQESVLGLTAPKLEAVRVGFVGLGMRGPGAVERFTYIPGTQVVALCDYELQRAEACQEILKRASMLKAAVYSGEKNSANVPTSTWYTSPPTGCITSLWPSVRWRMASM